jgi:hypothetical protein
MIRVAEIWIKYIYFGLATLACVTACSQPLELLLFNNTSGPIEIHLLGKNIAIGPNSSARFKYPATGEEWTLRLSASGCNLTYLPPHYPKYPFGPHPYNVPLKAQVEPDLMIYLVPPDTKAVSDVSLFASLQTQGFPLPANARACFHGPDT